MRNLSFGRVLLFAGLIASAAAAQWKAPNDPAYRRYPQSPHQENLFLLGMEEAWKLEKGSPKVVVAVVDLAFDAAHPDLKGKLWSNPKEIPANGLDDDGNGFADDIHGWDFEGGDASLEGTGSEHGNHVAGIIGAETNNGLGIAGMAPNCPLMLVKVGNAGALRDGDVMARAIRYCADNGARVICMNHGLSEHYPGWHVPINGRLKEACDYAYTKGALIVSCTTSNDGAYYPICFQAGYDSVVGTGASDLRGKPSPIYGGSQACEVIAPGGSYENGSDHSKEAVYSCYQLTGQQFHYYAGGCMATPHVAALLALVLSHRDGIDIEQARQVVRNTAAGAKAGFDVRWGHGLIQPVRALSVTKEQLAPMVELAGERPEVSISGASPRTATAKVRNSGAVDGSATLTLRAGDRAVASTETIVRGLGTAEVRWRLPSDATAENLSVQIAAHGMARPRIYPPGADVKLTVADEDLAVRTAPNGAAGLIATIRNAGRIDAERVAVILHQHEPGVSARKGPASRMLEARTIAVPALGAAEAEFPLVSVPDRSDLWVEIEQLDIGAPHVPRELGKARLKLK